MIQYRQNVWFDAPAPHLGAANTLSAAIAGTEHRHPGIIPDLRTSQTILIGSDYSGSHQTAQFRIISLVITNVERIGIWNAQRQGVRAAMLPQQRRMSYKGLNDRHRRAALIPFLAAANQMPGLLVSIAIDKSIPTIFADETPDQRTTHPAFLGWKPKLIERAMRIIHLTSLLLRGLSAPGQDVCWFTDQDDIVANERRLRSFVNLTATISSRYLQHPLRNLRIGTSACDTGGRDIEDFLAIPDLAAGALQELLTAGLTRMILDAPSLFLQKDEAIAAKASNIMNWFADNTQPLRRLTFVIDQPKIGPWRITTLRAHGSRDSDAAAYAPIL